MRLFRQVRQDKFPFKRYNKSTNSVKVMFQIQIQMFFSDFEEENANFHEKISHFSHFVKKIMLYLPKKEGFFYRQDKTVSIFLSFSKNNGREFIAAGKEVPV